MRRSCFTTALLLILFCLPAAHAQDAGESARQARAELQQLRAKIEQVESALAKGRERHDTLTEQLSETGRAVRHTTRQLQALEQDIDALQQQVARLKHERDQEQLRLTDQLHALRAQVQAAYRTGRTSKLRLLLAGREPAHIGRMLVYYDYFSQAQAKQVAQLRGQLAELARRQSALEGKQRQLSVRQDARAATLTRLQHQRSERKTTLAALEQQLAVRESTLADYRTSANRLKDLIAALGKALQQPAGAVPGAFTALKGHMQPPARGAILARFGAAKANGLMHWQGQWRATAKGAPVHAVAAGRVVYVGYMHHYGLIVVLEHAGGYFTVYGHTLASYVDIGDHVKRNEVIARAGSSGGHRRNGVYFEIRKGEQALDPSLWLAG